MSAPTISLRPLRTITAGLLLMGLASSQEVAWEYVGVPQVTRVQEFTAGIGDVDADGYRDLVAVMQVFGRGYELWTLSGKDGRPLRSRGITPGYHVQGLASAGDMDGDGIGDYAVAAQDDLGVRPTTLEVRSGRDEHLIWQATNIWASFFGFSIEGDLDVDGDGKPDVIVTAPGDGSIGAVYAYSNRGALLYLVRGTPQLWIGNRNSPQSLGRVGDVDLDGADDFVVGGTDRVAGTGVAIVLSGRTGNVLVIGRDDRPSYLGEVVDGCGDMDGDGIPDFVAGGEATLVSGVVRAFSGKTGAAIHTWRDLDVCFGATALRSGGIDVDLDGVPDVIVGGCTSMWVLSGRDGSIIFQQLNQREDYGVVSAVLGVQPGSRFPVFTVAQPAYMFTPGHPFVYLGRLLAYRGSPRGVEVFGPSCRGTTVAAPRVGARDLGAGGVRITVKDGTPGAPAALLLGFSRTHWGGQALPYPLDVLGLPGCSLQTSIDLLLPITAGTVGLARGYASFDIPTPLLPTGSKLYAQWWCHGGKPLEAGAFSDAVLWHF